MSLSAENLSMENSAVQPAILELISYSPDQYFYYKDQGVDDLLKHLNPTFVNWINIDGLHDAQIFEKLGKAFSLHNLLLEDLSTETQPKAEAYDQYLFFTLKMLHGIKSHQIDYEQISFVLGANYLLSFQEKEGDFFDGFRERIRHDQGRVRKMKSDYLLYRLIDIIIDQYYSVLENIGARIEHIEDDIVRKAGNAHFKDIQGIKKELIYLRKALYPLRDAISSLRNGESNYISQPNLRYYSDLYDHVTQLISSLDTFRDLTTSLMDMHMNQMNNSMNEVMKVLAVISTIFMPLSFIVGFYGMNFENMPEFKWAYGHTYIVLLSCTTALAMVFYFRHKKWF
jgi:magnesium transporter